MKIFIFCFTLICYLENDSFVFCGIPDYYWRDYNGTIPTDAVEGGAVDRNTIYIGHVVFTDIHGVFPATVFPGNRYLLSSYRGKTLSSRGGAQVLCSTQKNKFKWIPASAHDFPNLKTLIIGGSEFDKDIYVGRIRKKGNDFIGLVFPELGEMWVRTENNGQEGHRRGYDVLGYVD